MIQCFQFNGNDVDITAVNRKLFDLAVKLEIFSLLRVQMIHYEAWKATDVLLECLVCIDPSKRYTQEFINKTGEIVVDSKISGDSFIGVSFLCLKIKTITTKNKGLDQLQQQNSTFLSSKYTVYFVLSFKSQRGNIIHSSDLNRSKTRSARMAHEYGRFSHRLKTFLVFLISLTV